MPWNQNFRYNLHCKHTFWHLKLKTKDFSKFLKQYTCTFQTTACMHLTLCGWYWGVLEILVLVLLLLRTFENIGIGIGYC